MLKIGEMLICAWTIDILPLIDRSISIETNTAFIDWFNPIMPTVRFWDTKSTLAHFKGD